MHKIRFNQLKVILVGSLVLVFMGLLLAGCGNKKVATVNGEAITQEEFDRRLAVVQQYYEKNLGIKFEGDNGEEMLKDLREMVLNQLVDECLLLQEARKQEIEVTGKEIQKRLDQEKLMVGGEEAYQELLKSTNLSEGDRQAEIERQLIIEKLREQVVADQSVSEEEIQKYFEENQEQFMAPEQVSVHYILVKTEEEGQEIINKLKAGSDFAQLAVEKSIDPSVKENKGNLGYFSRDAQFVPEFKEAAFSLEVGELTQKPVKSDLGYFIIRVDDKKPARQQTLEEVKDSIAEGLKYNKENEKFQQFIKEIRQQSSIDTKLT